jgi:predicted NAD/FAD-binding protein
MRMKLAIVGAGISGLTCAWLLHTRHEITVFETERQAGGHSNTVEFELDGRQYRIDTGFIVYNDRTYPNFIELLRQLDVEGAPTEMSFAVRCDRTGIEYSGTNLSGVFAQRRNLLRPRFLRMVWDILRFNRQGCSDADFADPTETVGSYLQRCGYGQSFIDHYLLPMGAAIWSCPRGTFAQFPIRFILEFYRNHGLLSLTNRPQWYTIPGGSRKYVTRLTQPFRDRIRTDSPVRSVRRAADGVFISTEQGTEHFDEVIFACHSDQALALLQDPGPLEQRVLSGFPWEVNEAVLHFDESVLPRTRRAWSAWNYRISTQPETRVAITYNMNILQHIQSPRTFSVTLNDTGFIRPETVISRHQYSHPVFTTARTALQAEHPHMIRVNRTSYCGAWWANGFHEDGVCSALAVCRRFGIESIAAEGAARRALITSAAHPEQPQASFAARAGSRS